MGFVMRFLGGWALAFAALDVSEIFGPQDLSGQSLAILIVAGYLFVMFAPVGD